MRIDSPATCMNHLDAFHRAQSAQPDAGSVLLSSPTTRNVVLAITYTSIPNTCHQVRGLLTSQENCHLEVLGNYRAPRKGIRIDKTQPYEAEDPPLPNGTGTRLHQYLR